MSNTASYSSSPVIMGQDISLSGFAGMTADGMLSYKLFGNYKYNAPSSRLSNTFQEIGHSAISGAYSRAFGGMVTNALERKNIFAGFAENLRYGAAGGFSAAVGKDLLFGTPKPLIGDPIVQHTVTSGNELLDIKNEPLYRGGGIYGFFSKPHKIPIIGTLPAILPQGFAGLGRDILVNETGDIDDDRYLWIHETAHYWQYELYGYGGVSGALGLEQIGGIWGNNLYETFGTYEFQAHFMAIHRDLYF